MRVLLDTNVLAAAFATRGLCEDVLRTVLSEHSLLTSDMILGELERILSDKLRMSTRRVHEVVAFIREHGQVVVPVAPAPWPKDDSDDRWIVAAALSGSADLMVTGDKDLIAVGDAVGFPIVTPRGFWESLRTSAARTRPD